MLHNERQGGGFCEDLESRKMRLKNDLGIRGDVEIGDVLVPLLEGDKPFKNAFANLHKLFQSFE